MKVFLSWSGRISRNVAEVLREWLPNVIQAIDPWMSSEDIEKGSRWSNEIASHLSTVTAGIVCVTPENQEAPWLNFEAGALSRTIDKVFVCPYLFRLKPTDLNGPLVQFQLSEADESDTLKLLKTLNKALKDSALTEKTLSASFERWWPELKTKLGAIDSLEPARSRRRSTEEFLEEILTTVREQTNELSSIGARLDSSQHISPRTVYGYGSNEALPINALNPLALNSLNAYGPSGINTVGSLYGLQDAFATRDFNALQYLMALIEKKAASQPSKQPEVEPEKDDEEGIIPE